jgi:tetratricopeptide (TPR) repeat protein
VKRWAVKNRAVLVAATLLVVSESRAASLWDVVRDPRVLRVERALIEAERARLPQQVSPDALAQLRVLESHVAMEAAVILEEAGGVGLNDPDVDYFLGDCLVVADNGHDEEARRILERAIAAAPDSPRAAHGWFQIAIAADRLRDFEGTRLAYAEALRLEWDHNHRAAIYMNRGEASMALGRLREARVDYETALAITDDSEIHALAAWDLAVALGRDEDLPDALRRAWEAVQYRFRDLEGNTITALQLPSVSFTPSYEIYYYQALGGMAAAEHADNAEARRVQLELAISDLRRYLAEARPAKDRWVSNVELALVWCTRRLGRR